MYNHDLCCLWVPCVGQWSWCCHRQGWWMRPVLLPNAEWSIPQPEAMLMFMGCAASRGHTDVSGLRCHVRPWWCSWSRLPPRALSGLWSYWSWGHVRGLCCHQKTCGSPWSVVSLTIKRKETSFALISMTTDTQWERRKWKAFCDKPYLHSNPSKTSA